MELSAARELTLRFNESRTNNNYEYQKLRRFQKPDKKCQDFFETVSTDGLKLEIESSQNDFTQLFMFQRILEKFTKFTRYVAIMNCLPRIGDLFEAICNIIKQSSLL